MFVPGRPLQPRQMFVVKAAAYPSEAPFRCSTLGSAPGLTRKHWTWLERPARNKHTSLLRKIVNYGRKTFYNPWDLYHKTSRIRNLQKIDRFCNKLVFFLWSVTNTRAWENSQAHYRICTLQLYHVFIVQVLAPNVIKLFTAVIYECS